ncbi:hypothetical protein BDK51DRAFT_32338, partial [Blyttiomyces helicus]
MDGTTAVKNRIAMVDEFNDNPSIYVFLLTTKVGGLGINLTGANRLIIFDPDWNPSTDVQARERAWRVGQTRSVTVYRLMTSGTIEEKIYHRQIFKQFLSNKILKDPRQRRFFKSNDLHDLFVLGKDAVDGTTETAELFAGGGVDVEVEVARKGKGKGKDRAEGKGKGKSKGEDERVRREEETARDEEDMAQLRTIPDLAKVDDYRAPSDRTTAASPTTPTAPAKADDDDDSRILSTLFSKSGVHSALHHDAIMDASGAEAVLVEQEASRVADEAVAALKASRRRIRGAAVGVPTWTGRSGSAGAPSVGRRRFGTTSLATVGAFPTAPIHPPPPSEQARVSSPALPIYIPNIPTSSSSSSSTASASAQPFTGTSSGFRTFPSATGLRIAPTHSSALLAALRRDSASTQRQPPPPPPDAAASAPDIDPSSRQGLILRLRDALAAAGGRAATADLVAACSDRVSGEDIVLFRKMLKGIADFEKVEGEANVFNESLTTGRFRGSFEKRKDLRHAAAARSGSSDPIGPEEVTSGGIESGRWTDGQKTDLPWLISESIFLPPAKKPRPATPLSLHPVSRSLYKDNDTDDIPSFVPNPSHARMNSTFDCIANSPAKFLTANLSVDLPRIDLLLLGWGGNVCSVLYTAHCANALEQTETLDFTCVDSEAATIARNVFLLQFFILNRNNPERLSRAFAIFFHMYLD